MPTRRCIERGCDNAAVLGPRCVVHRRARKAAADAKRPNAVARGYVSRGWRRRREEVLERDPVCTWGNQPSDDGPRTARIRPVAPDAWEQRYCDAASTVAAHIVPREQGGSDELVNLRGLCKLHHDRETIAREGGFGRPTR